jgi:hypothetical protein
MSPRSRLTQTLGPSDGSPYTCFRPSLATGNIILIRAAAAELAHISLGDALCVCVAIRDAEPERFERAALRWIARYCVERPTVTLADVRTAAEAFERMVKRPEDALTTLQRLCR